MTNDDDLFGPPHAQLVHALTTPFAWPQSGLEPLPWFPFTVAASRGNVEAAERIARRAERAYWYLRKLLAIHAALSPARARPRRLAAICRSRDVRHLAFHRVGQSRRRAPSLPTHGTTSAASLRGACPQPPCRPWSRFMAPIASMPTGPTSRRVAEALVAHDLARIVVEEARREISRAVAEARVRQLCAGRGAGRHGPGRVASPGNPGRSDARARAPRPTRRPSIPRKSALTPFEAALVQLALTRAAYVAYADQQGAPLARWFAYARGNRRRRACGMATAISAACSPVKCTRRSARSPSARASGSPTRAA